MTNLKPFNLKKALAGEKVVTKSGYPVVAIFCDKIIIEKKDIEYCRPVIFIYKTNEKYYSMIATMSGHSENSHHDLFLLPTVKTYWVNVYKNPDCNEFITGNVFHSEAEAIYNATSEYKSKKGKYIKTISFDLEEEE